MSEEIKKDDVPPVTGDDVAPEKKEQPKRLKGRGSPYKRCETDFPFDHHILRFLHGCTFFAELSRHVRKTPTKDLSTMGVTYDPELDDITLYWNPEYAAKLTDEEIHGVLTHEYYHLIFGHVSARRKQPHLAWNIATDAAINSIITTNDTPYDMLGKLPPGCVIPGKPWADNKDKNYAKIAASPISKLIESWPELETSEFYFAELMKFKEVFDKQNRCMICGKRRLTREERDEHDKKQQEKQEKDEKDAAEKSDQGNEKDDQGKPQPGDSDDHEHADEGSPCGCGEDHCTCKGGPGGDSFFGEGMGGECDDHSSWDDLTQEEREYIEGRAKDIVRQAVDKADQTCDGWGNVPGQIREEIRKSVSELVDWRAVLRNFIGTITAGDRMSTIRRINKRYPYIHPGVKRGHLPKLLIALDQSGSMSNDAVELLFGELERLVRKIDVDIMPFDTECSDALLQKWRKGYRPKTFKRDKCGGTDFSAVTNWVNDPRKRGKYDGILYMTDGECSRPARCYVKRGWIIIPDRKMCFDPAPETVIHLSKEQKRKGSWR
jgi:predicted metal-dependent peptidase